MHDIFFKPYPTYNETIPFSSISEQDYEPAIDKGIALSKEEINNICNDTNNPDFENTIVALERSGRELDKVLNAFYPLLSAMSSDEMMQISLRVSPKLSEHSTSISLNERLWKRIESVYDNRDSLDLDVEDSMLLKRTYDSFARNGALLKGKDRESFREIQAELNLLTTQFGQNVLKELNSKHLLLEKDDLEGLSEDLIEGASLAAKENGHDGKFLFTLEQPVYMAFMKQSQRRDLRERMYRLYTGRNIKGEFSNIDILKRIAELRHKKANLLGFDTYASYALKNTMAETPENVYKLLNELRDAYKKPLADEIERLQKYASEIEKCHIDLKPWDYSYYSNRLRKNLYDYDEEELRPYFELNNVITGVFGLAEKLYGISFVESDKIETYHPDVKAYEVTDSDGSYLGVLYTDFFPRPSKRPGAWMTDFKPEWIDADGKNSRPHVSIVMNFTKPTLTKPSLLAPYEVGTFLHEFGHALHGLFANTRYAYLSGTNVYRDFVELPSQFNENYLTQKAFLDGFARHYRTGEPIPVEMIDRIVKSAQFGAAYACMRQLGFGFLDMAWHSVTEPINDVEAFEKEACAATSPFDHIDGSLISPQFSHIFSGGYAAGYYSYKWAEVLDADAFALFKERGIFDRDTAETFRKEILEKGGTEAPGTLYRRFRRRNASIKALLERDGLR